MSIGIADLVADDRARMWAKARRDGIIRMVATEPGVIWADGHKLMTCGGHTGHFATPIALCIDETWAAAIAQAIKAQRATTAKTGVVEDESAVAKRFAQKPKVDSSSGGVGDE